MTELARQIVESLRNDPEAWSEQLLSLVHDTGIEVQYGRPFERGEVYVAILLKPRRHRFGWIDSWRVKRAIRGWFAQPLQELKS